MDLQRMLDMCNRDQWKTEDLDWSQKPRELSRSDEEAIVQLFTDMSVIEKLAGALFAEQARRAKDPTLRAIFESFVVDEERHSVVASRLADHYNVHHYRVYAPNYALSRFFPHFVKAVTYLNDDVANAYITGGELVLDVALLRSLNDYVSDGMSAQAMVLINRDESRHIAIDFYMAEQYSKPEYLDVIRARSREPLRQRAVAWWTFANVLYYARPFFQGVFFEPMELVDPSKKRLREAFKRMQLLGVKPGVSDRSFGLFMKRLQDIANHPVGGPLFGKAAARLAGVRPEFLTILYSEQEASQAQSMSFEELAEESIASKYKPD